MKEDGEAEVDIIPSQPRCGCLMLSIWHTSFTGSELSAQYDAVM